MSLIKTSYSKNKKKCHFIFLILGFLFQWNPGRLDMIFYDNSSKNNIKLRKDYAEKFNETNGIEIQSQHLGGNRQLSMEVIADEYLTN